MPFYKDIQNKVHELSMQDIANGGLLLLPAGYTEISEEEAETILAEEIQTPDSIALQREAIKAQFTDTLQIMVAAGDPVAILQVKNLANQLKALDE